MDTNLVKEPGGNLACESKCLKFVECVGEGGFRDAGGGCKVRENDSVIGDSAKDANFSDGCRIEADAGGDG